MLSDFVNCCLMIFILITTFYLLISYIILLQAAALLDAGISRGFRIKSHCMFDIWYLTSYQFDAQHDTWYIIIYLLWYNT